MNYSAQEQALICVLHTSFDAAYMALLEADKVSLDDNIQQHMRETIVPEVFNVLSQECERMGKSGGSRQEYFCQHGQLEISRRLSQDLSQEEAQHEASLDTIAHLELVPAFEQANT